MKTREDKYFDNNIRSRALKNKDLYEEIKKTDIDKYDINSNTIVLDSNTNVIDVDKIRDMLDRKYRENIPEKNYALEEQDVEIEEKYDTKEYDINNILEKARENQDVDYDKERLKKVHDTQYDILKNLNINKEQDIEKELEDTEEEIMNLVNTITALEMKNSESSGNTTALDLLSDLSDNDSESVYKTMQLDKEEISKKSLENLDEEDLSIEEKYDDFKELENDLKSNNLAIKLVIIVFVILVVIMGVIFINNKFNLGLF